RRPAGVSERSFVGCLQPRLGPGRYEDRVAERAGPARRDHAAHPGPDAHAVGCVAVSEYEMPSRVQREPTVEDVKQLMGASTPHFALQIRNRIKHLIAGLPADDPARRLGEQEIARLNELAR